MTFQQPLASGYNFLVPELGWQGAFGLKPFESSFGCLSPAPAVSVPTTHPRKGRPRSGSYTRQSFLPCVILFPKDKILPKMMPLIVFKFTCSTQSSCCNECCSCGVCFSPASAPYQSNCALTTGAGVDQKPSQQNVGPSPCALCWTHTSITPSCLQTESYVHPAAWSYGIFVRQNSLPIIDNCPWKLHEMASFYSSTLGTRHLGIFLIVPDLKDRNHSQTFVKIKML